MGRSRGKRDKTPGIRGREEKRKEIQIKGSTHEDPMKEEEGKERDTNQRKDISDGAEPDERTERSRAGKKGWKE